MALVIPPPPRVQPNGNFDVRELGEWLKEVYRVLTIVSGLPWGTVDKSGSSLGDLENKSFSDISDVVIKDYHIDWGSGTGQVDTDDVPEGSTNLYFADSRVLLALNTGKHTLKRTATAGDYTILSDDFYVGVTNTDAARTISLPTAVGREGQIYVVKDESGGAGVNNITLDGNGTETIDGALTYVINTNYDYVWIISDNANWFTI